MKKIYLFLFAAIASLSAIAQPNFNYTGGVQYWVVPSGVRQVSFDAYGAQGGGIGPIASFPAGATTTPGKGAHVMGMLQVTPGTTLAIYVGGAGQTGTAAGCAGGFNGGGNVFARPAGFNVFSGGGGGGATDVRAGGVSFGNRVVVAGGGGGGGYNGACTPGDQAGGDGGGLTGTGAFTCTGVLVATPYSYTLVATPTGGTQAAGGTGGALSNGTTTYSTGVTGGFGIGGDTGPTVTDPGIAGAGGGGYYGGGGGCFMGGAGGSSYYDPLLTSGVTSTVGAQSGNGMITICILSPGVIKGPTRLCTAQTITLSDTVGTGVWSTSNSVVATVDPTGVVTGVGPGVVNITYTVTSCTVMYAVYTINVTQSPGPVSGVNPLCVGTVTPFFDVTPGGYWTSSDIAAATVGTSSGYVSAVYPGSAMITYHDPSGGCFSTYHVDVDGIAGKLSVCKGLSIPLVSSTAGGVWTSSDTMVAKVGGSAVTGIVKGIDVGTATISYSSTVCPSHVTVTVNPVAPNSGADSICVAGTGYATNIVGGGMWSSSDGTVAKVGSSSGLITGISAGSATLSYLLPTGCLSTDSVKVIDKAPAITGVPEVCPGNSTPLADALPGGKWSSNDPTIASISSSGVVTGLIADTVSIMYTIRPGCVTYLNFVVNPVPATIMGTDTLCPGVKDTLSSDSKGGLWSTSTPLLDNIVDTTGHLVAIKSGLATIKYTLPTGCFATKNIFIYQPPVPTVTYNDGTKTFYTDLGYPSYQWYDSITGLIPHATSPSLAATSPEWYFVEITDALGCKSRSDVFYFPKQLSVKAVNGGVDINMYPNPVSGYLNIESSVKVRVVVSGVDGKIEIMKDDAKQVDMSRLASATYVISLYDESGQLLTVRKIVKQ